MSTVVIHTPGTLLQARGQHLEAITPDGARRHLPLHGVDRIHCYGRIQVTTPAIHLLARNSKELVYFSRRGRMRARLLSNPAHGVALRQAQYRLYDNPAASLALAQNIIAAKISNQRCVLVRAWRKEESLSEQQHNCLDRLQELQESCTQAIDNAQLMGYEGNAAKIYFRSWATCCGDYFPWNGRNRRPPKDPINALLSFGYTLLVGDAQAQLESIGFDPWLGILHGLRAGRPALALDIVEPFRPLIVDRLIIDLLSHKRLRDEHFSNWGEGAHSSDNEGSTDTDSNNPPQLTEAGRKIFLTAYERRMHNSSAIDDQGNPLGNRKDIRCQCQDLARFLRHHYSDLSHEEDSGIDKEEDSDDDGIESHTHNDSDDVTFQPILLRS